MDAATPVLTDGTPAALPAASPTDSPAHSAPSPKTPLEGALDAVAAAAASRPPQPDPPVHLVPADSAVPLDGAQP